MACYSPSTFKFTCWCGIKFRVFCPIACVEIGGSPIDDAVCGYPTTLPRQPNQEWGLPVSGGISMGNSPFERKITNRKPGNKSKTARNVKRGAFRDQNRIDETGSGTQTGKYREKGNKRVDLKV